MDTKDFKALGVSGDDKTRLKRRLKELKTQVKYSYFIIITNLIGFTKLR